VTAPNVTPTIHMFAPSKAIPSGPFPTGNVALIAPPPLDWILVTLWLKKLVTQTLIPSKASSAGPTPTAMGGNAEPSLEASLVTVPSFVFATQMVAPSKAIPVGLPPTPKLPRTVPSFALNLVTELLLEWSPTYWRRQRLAPSDSGRLV